MDKGYSGQSLTYHAATDCDADRGVEFSDNYIGDYWNDRFSSFHGYARCQIKIFENRDFGGAAYGYDLYTGYVGDAMNDRTSSIKFR